MEINKEKTVSFTGHRRLTFPHPIPHSNLSKIVQKEIYALIETLYEQGYKTYLNGMAIGFDMMAAETVLRFKEQNPDIKLYAVIPFQGQELRYSQMDKRWYQSICQRADEMIFVSDVYRSNDDYLKRNDYLIANSSVLISYCDGKQRSGTKSTVLKGLRAGLRVLNIYQMLSDCFSTQPHESRVF